jgi:hypothetical protein
MRAEATLPRVTLLVQTLGVLALAGGLMAVLRPARAPRPTWLAVAAVATVVGGYVFFTQVYRAGSLTVSIASHFRDIEPVDRRAIGGTGFPNSNEPFMRWVEVRVHPRDRVYLECGRRACSGSLAEWLTFRLTPRRFTDRPEQADWILFYGSDPGRAAYARGFERMRFARTYELAKVAP